MPLGDDSVHHKTDNVLPSLSMLFGINNQAIRVIFLNTGILKTQGNEHKLHANGVESFKRQACYCLKNICAHKHTNV